MPRLMLVFALGVFAHAAPAADLDEAARQITERTNRFRQENDLPPLETDETLRKTAADFAAFMAETDKYGHRADGRTPTMRAKAAGYEMCMVRENIGYQLDTGGTDVAELVETFAQGWIDSPSHRENMLARHATETAVAIAADESGDKHFAVQLFGRPRSASFRVTVVNRDDVTRTLSIESESGGDDIELPPGSRLKMRRCFPTEFSVQSDSSDETGGSMTVDDDAALEIRGGTIGRGAEDDPTGGTK